MLATSHDVIVIFDGSNVIDSVAFGCGIERFVNNLGNYNLAVLDYKEVKELLL
ncbi:MAG: hypothetical protein K1W06_00195 [Lachnospiraceae bacterium]